MLLEALKLYGTTEAKGAADNPTIMAWAHECGLNRAYGHDSVPWCGLFMAVCAKRATWSLPEMPLWALSWSEWGRPSERPMLGDVLTFKRDGGGHVALYVGEDTGAYHVLGGNQSDQVNITRIAKARLYKARQAPWRIGPPDNRRVIRMAANGPLSSNEA
jgi:uncharacterized protein (TIGR02594 family)